MLQRLQRHPHDNHERAESAAAVEALLQELSLADDVPVRLLNEGFRTLAALSPGLVARWALKFVKTSDPAGSETSLDWLDETLVMAPCSSEVALGESLIGVLKEWLPVDPDSCFEAPHVASLAARSALRVGVSTEAILALVREASPEPELVLADVVTASPPLPLSVSLPLALEATKVLRASDQKTAATTVVRAVVRDMSQDPGILADSKWLPVLLEFLQANA